MNTATAEPGAWSRGRWWLAIACVFLAQVSLIFWLAGREPLPAPPPRVPLVYAPDHASVEVAELLNPTIFALPNHQGYSGAAWMTVPQWKRPPIEWSNQPVALAPDAARLGGVFSGFVKTNTPKPYQVLPPPRPAPAPLASYPVLNLEPTRSTLRIEGDLASRPLLAPLPLPPQVAQDSLVTNSVVQVEVTPDGRVFSAELMNTGPAAGWRPADLTALRLAWAARFAPLAAPAPASAGTGAHGLGFTRGTLVFQWLTVPLPAADAPANPP